MEKLINKLINKDKIVKRKSLSKLVKEKINNYYKERYNDDTW